MLLLSRLFVPLFALASFGCTGGDLLVPGDGQPTDGEQPAPSATVSTITAAPASVDAVTGTSSIIVTVRDENGDPIQGASVTLQGTGSGNTLLQPGVTGSDGVATGTLSSTVPGVKVISAVLNGALEMSQTTEVTVTPATAATIELVAGNGQTAPAGEAVPAQPAVRITNALGEPVAGYEVTFVVLAGGGRVENVAQRTDSEGIARVSWVLGDAPGSNLLEVRAGSLIGSPVIFAAQGISGDDGNNGGGGGGTGGGGTGGGSGPSEADVDRLIFSVQPPSDVRENVTFTVHVSLVDASGNIVPLSGIFVYLDLFGEGDATPTNTLLRGEHFENTENGVAVFDVRVDATGRWLIEAKTDDLPTLGPHGPEPYPRTNVFDVD